jgi:branched-chain amino acid transport system ATP-binding protein
VPGATTSRWARAQGRSRRPKIAQSLSKFYYSVLSPAPIPVVPRLYERRNQKGGTLSGGEQQMLAIGRALMQNPRILLMDEPSMGLAPVLVDFIFETIKKLNQEEKTILLVEQNARLALQIAHRGYVLATGEITLTGPARELAENPEVQKAYLGED